MARARRDRVGIGLRIFGRQSIGCAANDQRPGSAAGDAIVVAAERCLVGNKEVAIVPVEVRPLHMLIGDHELAAVEGLPDGGADCPFVELPLVGKAVAGEELRPVQIAAGNEVDHTRNRIRTINGRSAVGDHLDTLHAQCRQHGRVDGTAVIDHAVAVDEDQRRIGADPAQVHRISIDDVARPTGLGTRILGYAQIEILRQFLDHAVDSDSGRRLNIPAAENRCSRADRNLGYTAARDDYCAALFELVAVNIFILGHRKGSCRQLGNGNCCQRDQTKALARRAI